MKQRIKIKRRKTNIRPLIGAGIFTSTLLSVFLAPKPVLAACPSDITSAGQTITNKAAVSYSDGGPTPYTQESNEVIVKIAEIAGVTVTAIGDVDVNTSSRNLGDVVGFDYLITNTGNDPTYFNLPSSVGIVGGILNTTATSYTENATTKDATGIKIVGFIDNDGDGTNNSTGILDTTVTSGGSTSGLTGIPYGGLIKPGDQIRVRVFVKINESRATFPVSVRYGNTGPNDNSSSTQNQPYDLNATPLDDVRTLDEPNSTAISADGCAAAVTAGPVNGEREAAGFYEIRVSTDADPLAMAKVLKTRASHDAGTNTAILTDDTITYRLDMKVDNIQINSKFTPAPLVGTTINLGRRILVSDVIPTGTAIDPTFDPSASLPAGWSAVFTTSSLGTSATAATWVAWDGTGAGATRIGFVHAGPLAPGYTTTTDLNGLKFRVVTSGVGAGTQIQIANIAQVFGETQVDTNGDGTPDAPAPNVDTNGDGTPDAPVIIYDESGDEKPNNFSDSNTPKDNPNTPSIDGSYYDPTTDTGEANPNTQDVDRNNDNTGTDRDPNNGGGEDNVFNLSLNPEAPSGILNGPDHQTTPTNQALGNPDAIGPNSNHDDFVEKAGSPTPADLLNPVNFNNTIRNPASNADDLDNVVLLPLTAAAAEAATGHNGFGGTLPSNTIPNGTTVTISYDGNKNGNYTDIGAGGSDQVALYTYATATGWTLTTGTNLPLGASGVTIPKLIRDNNNGGIYDADYRVTIDPPTGVAIGNVIPVPIVAYPENTAGSGFDKNTDSVFNITIDRLFIGGFLTVNKSVRLLDASGNVLQGYSDPTVPTSPTWNPQPGQLLEYKIEYKNNGTRDTSGTGNISLQVTAGSLVITEDGRVDFTNDATLNGDGNNWALDNSGDGSPDTDIDTSNVSGGTNATKPGTFGYFNSAGTAVTGATSGINGVSDVTRYTYTQTGELLPQDSGIFTFRRRVN